MSEFITSLHEVFERFGRIDTRRMFGGHGVYHEGRMFALSSGDRLYLKVDGQTVAYFDRLQLPHFEYQRKEKTMQMSYREAPAELYEDRDEAVLRSGQKPKARNTLSKGAR